MSPCLAARGLVDVGTRDIAMCDWWRMLYEAPQRKNLPVLLTRRFAAFARFVYSLCTICCRRCCTGVLVTKRNTAWCTEHVHCARASGGGIHNQQDNPHRKLVSTFTSFSIHLPALYFEVQSVVLLYCSHSFICCLFDYYLLLVIIHA